MFIAVVVVTIVLNVIIALASFASVLLIGGDTSSIYGTATYEASDELLGATNSLSSKFDNMSNTLVDYNGNTIKLGVNGDAEATCITIPLSIECFDKDFCLSTKAYI